jgi:hypothetical protein
VDENQMKKKLLVVGDSFMRPDANYPGQHWSEMLPEYEILMHAVSGSSNGIVAWKFFEGLKLSPDAVVLGFTIPNRIEFRLDAKKDYPKRIWTTNAHQDLTADQRLATDYYLATADEQMMMFKACVQARCMLLECQLRGLPFAYSLNCLFNNLVVLPYPSSPEVRDLLGEFSPHECTNLATYQGFKMSPGFHTDDPVWQKRMATEVAHILTTVDFS